MLETSEANPVCENGARAAAWTRVAAGFWLTMLAVVCGKAVVMPTKHTVWPIYQAASLHWWSGESLYASYPGLDIYRYSPTFATLLSPFAWMPLGIGGALWAALNIGALLASLIVLERQLLPTRFHATCKPAFLILSALATWGMVWNLQCNALVLALVIFGMAALTRERWWLAALLLAAPVFIKIWPIAPALILLVCWPRQLLGRFALALAGFALLPFLTRPPTAVIDCYVDWYTAMTTIQHGRWPGYRDLWTLWSFLDAPVPKLGYRVLQLGAALGILLLCLECRRRGATLRKQLTFLLGNWCCWQLLLGPGSERNTYGLIAPVMVWAVLAAWQQGVGRLWPTVLFAGYLLLQSGDIERVLRNQFPPAEAGLPVVVLLFFAWLVHYGLTVARTKSDSIALHPGQWSAAA